MNFSPFTNNSTSTYTTNSTSISMRWGIRFQKSFDW